MSLTCFYFVGNLKVIWEVREFIQATVSVEHVKKVWNSIDKRILSIVLSGVSSNFTAKLNKARFIVKLCFVVKIDCPDPDSGIPDK